MKIDAVGIGAYLESSKVKPTSSREIYPQKEESKIKETVGKEVSSDRLELSTAHTDLTGLLSLEEKEFLEKLFGYEQSIRNLNSNFKSYTKQHNQNEKIMGTKIDIIA